MFSQLGVSDGGTLELEISCLHFSLAIINSALYIRPTLVLHNLTHSFVSQKITVPSEHAKQSGLLIKAKSEDNDNRQPLAQTQKGFGKKFLKDIRLLADFIYT